MSEMKEDGLRAFESEIIIKARKEERKARRTRITMVLVFLAGMVTGNLMNDRGTTVRTENAPTSITETVQPSLNAQTTPQTPTVKPAFPRIEACRQAEVPDVVSEASPFKCLSEKGDTLWDISEKFCGNPWIYETIAVDNDMSEPDKLSIGKELVLKCRDELTPEDEEFLFEDSTQIETPTPTAQEPSINTPTTVAENATAVEGSDTSENSTTYELPVLPEKENVEIAENVPTVQSEGVNLVAKTEEKPLTKTETKKLPKQYLDKGTYELFLQGNTLADSVRGEYPSLILEEKGEDGKWKSRKTTVTVTRTSDGNLKLRIPIVSKTRITPASTLSSFFGGEIPTEIRLETIKTHGNMVKNALMPKSMGKNVYAKLYTSYPSRSNNWLVRTVRSNKFLMVAEVAGSVALAVPTGGFSLSGLIMPVTSNIVLPTISSLAQKKARLAQEQALQLLEQANQTEEEGEE